MANTKKVLVAIDFGSSGTRAIWNEAETGEAANLLTIGPEILEVSTRNILDSGLSSGKPESRILIEIEDSLFAIGKKARDLRGKSPIEETKYQTAALKTVAVVGVIAAYLETANLEVSITALLPFSEYQDRKSFSEIVKKQLKVFKFLDNEVNCKVTSMSVKPEGAGIAIAHINECDYFTERNTLIFMAGHRDTSCLPFPLGAPPEGTDTLGDQLGFLEFQNQVVRRASLNVKAENQAKLPEYLFKSRKQPEYTERIAKMVVSRDIAKKTAEIEAAIRDSQIWYIDTLTHWIKTTLGDFLYEIDQVVVGGGTAFYFQEELTEFFAEQSAQLDNIKWSGLTQKDELERFFGVSLSPEAAVRLADVYGLYQDAVAKLPEFQSHRNDSEFNAEETEIELSTAERAATNGNRRKKVTL